MRERVFFGTVSEHRARALALYEIVRERVVALVPTASVEHVGSTALPDGLTKGDLDVQVRVSAEHFEAACRALAAIYEHNPGGVSALGRSFKDDATEPPLGLHVTVIDGPSDFQFRQRDLLCSRPDLRAEYDAIKRRFEGGDMAAYREAKHEFFMRVALVVE